MDRWAELDRENREVARQNLQVEQGGRCALCRAKKELVLDHNHESGEIRGLLCHGCNLLLGHIEGKTFSFGELEEYLRRGRPRVERDAMFMGVARQFSYRSTCPRRSVGAVFVRDSRIIAHGYNGAPPGMPHCTDVGCQVEGTSGCQRALHAELNAITYAARKGVRTEGSTCYVTVSPCRYCAKLLITSGVVRVVYETEFRTADGLEILVKGGIQTEHLTDEVPDPSL